MIHNRPRRATGSPSPSSKTATRRAPPKSTRSCSPTLRPARLERRSLGSVSPLGEVADAFGLVDAPPSEEATAIAPLAPAHQTDRFVSPDLQRPVSRKRSARRPEYQFYWSD